jgi:ParB family chromosome partitioning protein
MAKRKRLTPPAPDALQPTPEVKSSTNRWEGLRRSAPIADVAGAAATRAALDEISTALTSAREEGRLISKLPLATIETGNLVRDRLTLDEEELETLKSSIAIRGQQTPIEVVALGEDRYGLISGLRRVVALQALGEKEVLALIRMPQSAAEAYLAMVEENEIRAGLSYYERARLAAEATRMRVYPTVNRAVADLFAAAPSAKRSKILRFVVVYEKLGDVLQFPEAIPEALGLRLSAVLESDKRLLSRLRDRLRKNPAPDSATERRQLEMGLSGGGKGSVKATPKGAEVVPGVFLHIGKAQITLAGPRVNAALRDRLATFLMGQSDV